MDANDRITRIKKDSVGEQKIKDLYINGVQVPVVSSMKKNGAGEITELYLNEVKQNFPENGVLNAWETSVPCFILNNPLDPESDLPFVFINADGTFCTTLEEVGGAKFGVDLFYLGNGTPNYIYRTNDSDEYPPFKGDDGLTLAYVDNSIFTVESGVIALPNPSDPLSSITYSIRLPQEGDYCYPGYSLHDLFIERGT